ncbi:cell adhesion molecule 3-like [Ruditapes philippinarum]|uniref:cell adhesion molecule 3-like n=1 Tax=Ruditapes philippinarum TaxID=129788 RepID=UPI00295AFECC|nr:cell adhesion molecule 3-like [Ruditapes philippinarum]
MNRFALAYIINSTLVSVVKPNSILLLPRLVKAVENSSATLTCSKENGSINETIWTNSQIAEDANLTFNNGKCIVTGFLLNSDLFDGKCYGNGTYSVMLKKINRTQHGTEWTCSETVTMKSNIVSFYVTVPAKNVDIRLLDEKLYMRENQTQTVRCQTSPCRPNPTVKWYLRHYYSKITYDITENSTQSYSLEEYELMAAESILEFIPNRTFNNWHLFCEVWTQVDNADISSQFIVVNVSFPPSRVVFLISSKLSEAGAFIANNGQNVSFFCMAVSNPKSEIIIRDQRDKQLTTLKDTKFVDHTKLNVSCADAGHYTCYARNMLTVGEEATSNHILIVRCPPRPKTVKDDNVTALLGSDVTLPFTAHDLFDGQNKTAFTWYKQNTSLQMTLVNI